MKRSVPLEESSVSELPVSVIMLSPASTDVNRFANSIVAQAARVQASTGPTANEFPDIEKLPLHMLQSTRLETLPSAKVSVYDAEVGRGWADGWPGAATETSVQVPSSSAALCAGLNTPGTPVGDVIVEHAIDDTLAATTMTRSEQVRIVRVRDH